jgi:hypothetical protein
LRLREDLPTTLVLRPRCGGGATSGWKPGRWRHSKRWRSNRTTGSSSRTFRGGRRPLHRQSPLWWREIGKKPGGQRKAGHQALRSRGRRGHTSRGHRGSGKPSRLAASGRNLRHCRAVAGALKRLPRPRLRLQVHQRASGAPRPDRRDLGERQTRSAQSWDAVGHREDQLVAQCPQEASVVHRTRGAGHRVLASLLQRGHRCETTHTKSLDPLPLGGATSTQTMTYWLKLLGKGNVQPEQVSAVPSSRAMPDVDASAPAAHTSCFTSGSLPLSRCPTQLEEP